MAEGSEGDGDEEEEEEEEEEEGGEEDEAAYRAALAEAGMGEGPLEAAGGAGSAGGGGRRGSESVEARLARLSAASRGEVEFSGSDGEGGSTEEEGEAGGEEGEEEDVEALLLALDGEEIEVDPDAPNLAEAEHSTAEGSEGRCLALVNMDWAQVQAVDLHALLQSCVPPQGGGSVLRVTIYPSDYGMARMEEEARLGPVRLLKAAALAAQRRGGSGSGGSKKGAPLLLGASSKPKHGGMAAAEEEERDTTDPAVLRAYELNKLKYYYAVAECDSAATAARVYEACDGLEFEDSSNVLDLRFVPEGTQFKNPPRDVSLGVPEDYQA